MRIYDNAIKDGLKRLQNMAPGYYKNVLEAREIWNALGSELNGVRDDIIRSVDANLLKRCDERDIEKYEKFLNITTDKSKSLDERRGVIASHYTGLGHFGAREIEEIVSLFIDGVVEVEFNASLITVKIYKGKAEAFPYENCLKILKSRVPAHIPLEIVYVGNIEAAVYAGAKGIYHGCITIKSQE